MGSMFHGKALPRGRLGRWPVVVVAMALAIPVLCLLREAIFGTTASDSSVFRYLGWRMTLGGGRCYVDAWDNSGPVLSLLNAVGYLLVPCGNVGPSLVFAILWMSAALLAYRFLRPYGKLAAAVAAFLLCLFGLGVCGGLFMNCREVPGLVFAALGSCLLFGRNGRLRSFFFGACVGLAFMDKAIFVAFGLSAVVLWLYDWLSGGEVRLFLSRCVFSFLGFAAVLAAITVAYLPDGVYPMWEAALFYNLLERIANDSSWLQWWAGTLRGWSIWDSGGWVLPLFALQLSASLYALCRLRTVVPARMAIYIGAWLFLEVVFVFAFKSFFEHYLIMAFLPISVLLALGLRLENPWPSRVAIAVSLALFSLCFRSGLVRSIERNRNRGEMYSWVANAMSGSEYVATVGGHEVSEFLACAGKKTRQRYFAPSFYLQFGGDERKKAVLEEMVSSLESPDVDWLVVEPGSFGCKWLERPEFRRAMAKYALEKEFPRLRFYKKTPYVPLTSVNR